MRDGMRSGLWSRLRGATHCARRDSTWSSFKQEWASMMTLMSPRPTCPLTETSTLLHHNGSPWRAPSVFCPGGPAAVRMPTLARRAAPGPISRETSAGAFGATRRPERNWSHDKLPPGCYWQRSSAPTHLHELSNKTVISQSINRDARHPAECSARCRLCGCYHQLRALLWFCSIDCCASQGLRLDAA